MTDHTGEAAGIGFTSDDSDKTTGSSKKDVVSVIALVKLGGVFGRSLVLQDSHRN